MKVRYIPAFLTLSILAAGLALGMTFAVPSFRAVASTDTPAAVTTGSIEAPVTLPVQDAGTMAPTSTPTPSPTPRPPRAITKIGPEISGGTNVDIGKPRVVKLRNVSREYVAEVRQAVGPDTLIIIRFQHDEPWPEGDPQQAARDWYGRQQGDILAMQAAAGPQIAFETAVNECPSEFLDWYVEFSLELIPLMHQDGVRVVAGNPSVGQWREDEWPKFKPVLDILKPNDFLGLHEYWADEDDLRNHWLTGRWTVPQIAAVLGRVKIVVTECGRDQVAGRGFSGWKLGADEGTYLWELETYDRLLRRSPNVVGATVFTVDPNWGSFDLYSLWPQVVYRYSLEPEALPTFDALPRPVYLPLIQGHQNVGPWSVFLPTVGNGQR